jgi:hypothetical protein
MAGDDNSTQFRLDLDASDFIDQAQSAAQAINGIGDVEGLSGLLETLGEMTPVIGAVGTAFIGLKATIGEVFAAEKVEQTEAQFQNLSNTAGVYSEKLKSGLMDASKGWADQTSVMESANKALTELDGGAEKLPEVMTMARQATAVFGGDMLQNFDMISQAIATGNTRMLRHIGITVDAKQAYIEYAKELGVTVDSLTKADQQQALMNAVLEKGAKQFAGVNESLTPAINLWQQFKATMTEVGEAVALAINKIAGPTVIAALHGLSSAAKDAGDFIKEHFGSGAEQAALRTESLAKKTLELKANIIQLQQTQEKNPGMFTAQDAVNLELYKKQLAEVVEESKKVMTQDQAFQAQKKAQEGQVAAGAKSNEEANQKERHEKMKAQEAKFAKDMDALDRQMTQEEIKNMDSVEEATKLYNRQRLEDAKKVDEQITQVKEKQHKRELNNAQADKEIAKLNEIKDKKMEQDDAKLAQMQIQALNNYQAESSNIFEGVARGFQTMSMKNTMALKDFGQFGDKTAQSFGNHMSNAFAQIGSGAKSASDALSGAFEGMVGEMATNYGQMMFLASVFPPNPAGLAAGAALMMLGGMLSGMAGGAPSMAAGSAATSGGGLAGTAANPAQPTLGGGMNTGPANVTIAIQGNMLMSDQTQNWLVQQIRGAADAQDFKIQSVGGGL